MDNEGANIPIGPSGPRYELIYLVGMGNEGWIDFRFTSMHKGILVIMQGYIGVSEQGLWIRLIDQLVGPIGLIKQLEPILV